METPQGLVKNNLWYNLLREKKRGVKSIIIDIGGWRKYTCICCLYIAGRIHQKLATLIVPGIWRTDVEEGFFTLLYLLNFEPCKYTTYSKTKAKQLFVSIVFCVNKPRKRGWLTWRKLKGSCWVGVVPHTRSGPWSKGGADVSVAIERKREASHCCEEEHVSNTDIV